MTYSSVINHLFELSFRAGSLNGNECQDKNFTGELVIMGHGKRKLGEAKGETKT